MIRITILGALLNLFLVALKLAVGIVVGSAALVADGIHSVSDFSTDAVVILGVRLSARPADKSHAFGHGKYETIAASFVGAALVGVGCFIAWKAGLSLYRGEHIISEWPVVTAAVISIGSKEWLYQVTQRLARRVKSVALHVNAWHHRSDALSSVAVLFGSIAGLAGWGHGDQLAAIVVGLMIAMVGVNALWRVFTELTEASISTEEQEAIIHSIHSVPEVRRWHSLRTRLMGREVFMDIHVHVDADLSLVEGHRICSAVEKAIEESMDRPINIVVHCEPEPDPDADEEEERQG